MVDGHLAPRRRLSSLRFHLLWLAAFLSLVVLIAVTEAIGGRADRASVPFQPWTVFVILAVTLAYSLAWWRRLDEAAREAHKWAWYWGANAGAVGALGLIMLGDRGVEAAGRVGFENTLVDGMALVLAFEAVTFLVAWGFWWLRRR